MELTKRKKALIADLSLFLVAIIWGSGFIVNKNALDFMDPIYILILRFSLATIILGIISYKKVMTISKGDILAGSIIGVFLFLAFLAQTVGLQYTSVSKSAFITASNVVMVPFILWFVSKKRLALYEIIAALLCFTGIGVLSLEGSFVIGLGDGLTFLCGIFFAMHIISVGLYSQKHDPILLTIIQFGLAAILSILAAFIFKVEFSPITTDMTFSMLYLVIANTLLAFGIQNIAQKYTTSSHAALILSLESVFGSIFSVLLLGEKITLKLIIGSFIILIAVLLAETEFQFLGNVKVCQDE